MEILRQRLSTILFKNKEVLNENLIESIVRKYIPKRINLLRIALRVSEGYI